MLTANQNPEQQARDNIDALLIQSGWLLVRTVSGADTTLTSFDKTVDKNFQDWIFKKQARPTKYIAEQVQWLRMIKDYIANSFHVDRDDFELDPFNMQGGLGKKRQLFGEETDAIINELNKKQVA